MKRFFSQFKEEGERSGVRVDIVFVNCKGAFTATAVMQRLLSSLWLKAGGNSDIGGMVGMLKDQVAKKDALLIIVADEAHVPLRHDRVRGDMLIYCLTRINEVAQGPKVCVSLCLVSNRDVLAMLEESTRGAFGRNNVIHLDRYTLEALRDIIVQRLEIAFHPGAASQECIELIADMAAGEGNARYALELLLTAGMAAECSGSDAVRAEHVRAAKAEIQPWVTHAMPQELEEHERLLLLGIARALRRKPYIGFEEAKGVYLVECECAGAKPKGKTQLRKILDALGRNGLIEIKREGRGRTAKFLITIEDVPAEALVEHLEEMK
ncbi:MAG: hypothetical protein AB1665_06150 [Candidatus Thermoplasmatota archaeon]